LKKIAIFVTIETFEMYSCPELDELIAIKNTKLKWLLLGYNCVCLSITV